MDYFTSDIHFCDTVTMLRDSLPFKTIKQHDKYMVKYFNKTAKQGDTVYVVGDLFDCDDGESTAWLEAKKYLKKIKSKIVLIMGNNEERIVKYFFNGDFEEFKHYCQECGIYDVMWNTALTFPYPTDMGPDADTSVIDRYTENGQVKFYLTHKPCEGKAEYFNIFGHTHREGGVYRPFGFNAGIQLNFMRFYTIDYIMDYLLYREPAQRMDIDLNTFDLPKNS